MGRNKHYERSDLWKTLILILFSCAVGLFVMVTVVTIVEHINIDKTDEDYLHSKNVERCTEKFDIFNHTDLDVCATIVCSDMNMTKSYAQSWLELEVTCMTKHRGTIDIGICSTDIPSCKAICINRIDIQNCLHER